MDILDKPDELPLRNWQIRTNLEHRNLRDRVPIQIGSQAEISYSLINSGCIVNGKVEHSILFSGVQVEHGAVVKDSIVMFDSKIGKKAKIEHTIVNTDLSIDEKTSFGTGKTTVKNDLLLETIGGIHVVSKIRVE
jgi:glucose-1-phosphate adenylyltransferase